MSGRGARWSDWLTARPVAHRGLHDRAAGLIENSLETAEAAIARGFAIECDVQRAACGTAMVFHDFTLDRLTQMTGAVAQYSASELAAARLAGTASVIPTLAAFLEAIGGRVPLFIEIKSRFDGAAALVAAVAAALKTYEGPVALMSFDPAAAREARSHRLHRPVGIVAETFGDHAEWASLSLGQKYRLSNLSDAYGAPPDFIAYNVKHLPSIACDTLRQQMGIPLLTWTVRTPEQRAVADAHADQMIFEGFIPEDRS